MVAKKINTRKLFITLGILVVLLAYFIIVELPRKPDEEEKDRIFQFVLADVNKFEIIKNDSIIEVERMINDWRISKPRVLSASKIDVDAYISDIKDLIIEKVVGENLPDLAVYGLDKPKLILNVFTGKGKNQKMYRLSIGNQNPDFSGFYAKLENDPRLVILENFTESIIDKDVFYFRDKDIFKVKVTDVKEIDLSLDKTRYRLQREEGPWRLTKPVIKTNLKEEQVTRILLPLSELKARKYYDGPLKVSLAQTSLLFPPITIRLKADRSYTLTVGNEVKNEGVYYAKWTDNDLIFSIDKMIIDDLKKNMVELTMIEKEDKTMPVSQTNGGKQ
ncbi:MAG: DUF4340 domain-containing protein [Spirochaetes bacterium]|nr:DUF4340 domain-containing protein [Spirochaetota bacterium]